MSPWKELEGCRVIGFSETFGDNVVLLFVKDESDNIKELVIDTEAIGHGLYRPVLYRKSDYMPKEVKE